MRTHLDLPSLHVSFEDIGAWLPGARRDRVRTLLLLHAFPLAARSWQPQLYSSPGGWRFIAPDLRGFGDSRPVPAAPALAPPLASHATALEGVATAAAPVIDDYANDQLALLDALGVDRAVIAGVSMGGYVAFAMMRLAPERIAGLLLSDTRATADSEQAKRGRKAMLAQLDEEGMAGIAESMIPRLFSPATRREQPQTVEWLRQMIRQNPVEGAREAVLRMMWRPDASPYLTEFDCPALVLNGTEDSLVPVDEARSLVSAFPAASLAVIHGAAHLPNVERPVEFNREMTRFLCLHF